MTVENTFNKIFSTFSWGVWIGIFSFSVISSFSICLLFKLSAIPVNCKLSSLRYCSWYVFQCLTNQSKHELNLCRHYIQYNLYTYPGQDEQGERTWSSQTFLVFWWVFVSAVISTYSGALISVLTTSQISLPFTDLTGLVDLVQMKQYKVCIHSGSAFHGAVKVELNLDSHFCSTYCSNMFDVGRIWKIRCIETIFVRVP